MLYKTTHCASLFPKTNFYTCPVVLSLNTFTLGPVDTYPVSFCSRLATLQY